MSGAGLEIAHEVIEAFWVLGVAETGPVGVEGGDGRAPMSEVGLDLAEVLAALQQVGRKTVAQMPSQKIELI